jgi:hypothetical protein
MDFKKAHNSHCGELKNLLASARHFFAAELLEIQNQLPEGVYLLTCIIVCILIIVLTVMVYLVIRCILET